MSADPTEDSNAAYGYKTGFGIDMLDTQNTTDGFGQGVPYPAGDTLTLTVGGISTGGGGGKLLVRVFYIGAVTPVVALPL